MGYLIKVKDVGKPWRIQHVFDAEGKRRDAYFDTKEDALEACGIIYVMRTDTAFEATEIVEE